jgi:hypothetical protein
MQHKLGSRFEQTARARPAPGLKLLPLKHDCPCRCPRCGCSSTPATEQVSRQHNGDDRPDVHDESLT